uniref:uncharacterized protein LOC100177550 n=1 Tax=Ciona intestinalis TaxID=7719 RepID=UPI000180C843|nr:uncharacterized protein LOC100177550 [Ciona intestinalis]|eukprot:XP_002127406.1 uncharacterized protein LOC100177550 [Ciona intestinalis]
MEILSEFPEPIQYLGHYHSQDEVYTVATCGNNWIHCFKGKEKHFSVQCCSSFAPLLLYSVIEIRKLTAEKFLGYAKNISTCEVENMVVAKGKVFGTSENQDLVVISAKFLLELFENKVSTLNKMMDYVEQNTSLAEITQNSKIKISFLKVVSFNEENNCLWMNKDLYVAMFGKVTEKRLLVLLLFLENGHIWYILLESGGKPVFLYATDCCCVDAYTDKTSLKVLSKNGKVTSIKKSNLNKFSVKEDWLHLKDTPETKCPNFCSQRISFKNCKGGLVADGCFLLWEKTINLQAETDFNVMLNEVEDLELRKSALTTLVEEKNVEYKRKQLLCKVSAEGSNLFHFLFCENEVEIKLDDKVSCPQFEVVCTNEKKIKTFHSSYRVVRIPACEVVNFTHLSCLFIDKNGAVQVGSKDLNVLMLLRNSDREFPTFAERNSFQMIFHNMFSEAVGDVKAFLLSPEVNDIKGASTFRIVNDYVCIKIVKRQDVYVVKIICTDEGILSKLHLVFLTKVRRHYQQTERIVKKIETIDEDIVYM